MKTASFATELGAMAIAFHGHKLSDLVFGYSTERAAERALNKRILDHESESFEIGEDLADVDELVWLLQSFAEGETTDFSNIPVDAHGATTFQRRVLKACREIPWGSTRTYGELAKLARRPGAARAVGSVMAGNRVPLVIPCHRVVPASGGLGGFSAPQGVKMKRRLLDAERNLLLV